MPKNIKAIAIHLPQFHPIPENDAWWGNGFTEWTNVAKAKPRFDGHYQPHLPADLGFYDLRLQEARIAQEELAKAHGIQGFCYYHYWFNGKRILEKPVDEKMKNPEEDFPFMLCWANENWTRVWNGGDKDVLLLQEYSEQDDAAHIQTLISYFKDDRYIKVNGKPVFVVYRPNLFPDIERTIQFWRKAVKKHGFPDLYIGHALATTYKNSKTRDGFDFKIDFQPKFSKRPTPINFNKQNKYWRKLKSALTLGSKKSYPLAYDYRAFVNLQIAREIDSFTMPGITPMWDNSPRRNTGYFILNNSTPGEYGRWLDHLVSNYDHSDKEESFLFINAWNEWAEGNHLEPCQKWGRQYLETTKEILDKHSTTD